MLIQAQVQIWMPPPHINIFSTFAFPLKTTHRIALIHSLRFSFWLGTKTSRQAASAELRT